MLTVGLNCKESREMAAKDRQVTELGWADLALVHQACDGQSASGRATGLENGQEIPTLA